MNWILRALFVCVVFPSTILGCDIETQKIIEKFRFLEEEINILKQNNGLLTQYINVLRHDNNVLTQDVNVLTQDINVLQHKSDVLELDNGMLKQDISVLKRDNTILKQQLVNKTGVDEIIADLQRTSPSSQKRLLESGALPGQLSHKIAFSVALTHHSAIGYHQFIEYNKVLTNIGNAYDTADGHFTVPTKGLYLLSVSVFNNQGHQQTVEMVKNGNQICTVYLDDDDYNMGSQTVVVVLEMNDKIWVRRFRDQGSSSLYGNPDEPYNTFSGVLLYEM